MILDRRFQILQHVSALDNLYIINIFTITYIQNQWSLSLAAKMCYLLQLDHFMTEFLQWLICLYKPVNYQLTKITDTA